MKKLVFVTIIVLYSFAGIAQSRSHINDDFLSTFDRLNNKTFSTLDLEDTSGTVFNTASLIGKTIYVDFWFTACAPCIKEIPYAQSLKKFFEKDTNIVFLNICIESADRKIVWKQMIKDKEITGINLFYIRNRPQKINLLREYNIMFPTYLLVNKDFKVIGYDAPRPSEEKWVQWAIAQATQNIPLSVAYKKMINRSKDFQAFVSSNQGNFSSL